MIETLSNTNSNWDNIPKEFVLTLGSLVRELHGVPDLGYPCSQLRADELLQQMQLVNKDGEANKLLEEHPDGARSLLIACMKYAANNGVPISFAEVAAAKVGPAAWDRDDIRGNLMFMMRALEKSGPQKIPEL